MIRTCQGWHDWCMERGTRGDQVFDILKDWKEQGRNDVIKDGETIASYVEHRIHNIFLAVAGMVSQGTIVVSEEESAGVPMMLFRGETLLMNVWKQYVEKEISNGKSSRNI